MRYLTKLISLLLTLTMISALALPAFAQDVGTNAAGKGTITISNAAKGETYKIYKLFDACVSPDGGSIAYTGTIPDSLTTYFTADASGNISATDDAKNGDEMSDGLRTALKAWTETATEITHAESDGSALNFKGLDYGYYVVTTTQGEQAISVDSTKPNVTIVDKNSSTPSNLTKTVDDDQINIGDTVTYTVTFKTSNYDGGGTTAQKIVSYTIEDTLPDFLENVQVTSIIVDNDGDAATTNDQTDVTAQFTNKKITIEWYDETNGKFLYDNGATVTMVYTAKVTDKAAIDGAGNTNKVTLTWEKEGDPDNPGKLETEETIYTFAIALKKVDEKGQALGGAVFQLPFYVKETPAADGAYIYASTVADTGLTNQLTTPDTDGVIIVKGVADGTYEISEVTAPDGYNKLLNPVSVTATKTGATTTHTTFYLDENGDFVEQETATTTKVVLDNDKIAATAVLVVNKTGAELPSTGGPGTTLFYILGGILAVGAGVLLVTKKRMNAKK